jgi:hypothetical protein
MSAIIFKEGEMANSGILNFDRIFIHVCFQLGKVQDQFYYSEHIFYTEFVSILYTLQTGVCTDSTIKLDHQWSVLDQGPVVTLTFAVFNLKEKYRQRVFKSRMLKKIFAIRQWKQQETG